MNKFNEQNFNKTYIPTIGVNFSVRTVKIDDERIKLQIWDTVNFNRSFRFCYMILRGTLYVYFKYFYRFPLYNFFWHTNE
jgi:Ras-related protein Rab-8A